MTTPYTYLLVWKKENKYYYGVRFAKNCHPNDLWSSYFTTSKNVKKFFEQNGPPDIIEARKIFTSKEKALLWEHKVLQKMNVIKNTKWLNKTNNVVIHPDDCSKSMKGKVGKQHPAFGRKNNFLSEYNKKNNAQRNKKYSGILHPMYGKKGKEHPAFGYNKITEERKEQLKEIMICPHCNKSGKRGGMQRWHFERCVDKTTNQQQKESHTCFGAI